MIAMEGEDYNDTNHFFLGGGDDEVDDSLNSLNNDIYYSCLFLVDCQTHMSLLFPVWPPHKTELVPKHGNIFYLNFFLSKEDVLYR